MVRSRREHIARRIRRSREDALLDTGNYILLTILTLAFLLPVLNVLSYSLSDPNVAIARRVWLFPKGFTFQAYRSIYGISEIWMGYANSLFYAIAGTAINMVVTVCAAYPLSKRNLAGRNAVMLLFVFTMFFSGGLVPTYLLVRSLGLLNTRWAMLIPTAMNVYYVIIMRTFFQHSVPDELLDAAEIDGAKQYRVLLSIVLPLSKPVLAVIALYYFVQHWNGYFQALIYLTDYSLYPLQLVLRDYLLSNVLVDSVRETSQDLSKIIAEREVFKYALIIVAMVPMLIIYPLAQKHFVKGVMIGSLKG